MKDQLPALAGRPFACAPDVAEPPPLPPLPREAAAAVVGEEYRGDIHAALQKGIHAWASLAELHLPRRAPLLDEWFMEGDLGFVYAPRGLGKTWLALALAAALSSGAACGPWRAAGACRVLYVDGEMPCEALHERIAGMGAGGHLSVLNHEALFHLAGAVLNLTDPATQDALTARMLADGVKVLFLDNLSCLFSGLKENDADAWENVLPWLLALRRRRIAVVLVHHAGRNKETMRGTSRREDAAFWVIRLDAAGGNDDAPRAGARFSSRFTKDRNSRLEQPAVEWSFRTEADGRVTVATQPAEGLDVLRQWVTDGLTGAEDIAREMGLTKGTVSKMAKRAMEAGWLCKNGREYALVST